MNYNFCTLFDKNYLYKGLALHESLVKNCPKFTLWILCMDTVTFDLLRKLNLANVELIKLDELEDSELLKIKNSRTPVEYCWTLTPSLPLYILKHYKHLNHIAYLDADIFFYHDPEPLFNELGGDDSVLIVKHNYAARYQEKEKTSGIFNVEFLIFKNNPHALECLQWWRDRCLEWCFFRSEDGKLGDQMYLNDWPSRFSGVHVLKYLGGGVAPWNIENYKFTQKNNLVFINNLPVIFYHFHAFKIYSANKFEPLTDYYYYPVIVQKKIYQPYFTSIQKAIAKVKNIDIKFQSGYTKIILAKYLWRKIILFLINLPIFSYIYISKTYQILRKNIFLISYLSCSFIFLLCLNNWLWPTTDEYFYSIISNAIKTSIIDHQISLYNIDSEHMPLIPFISFAYNFIFHNPSFVASRIFIIFFNSGIIILLYYLARELHLIKNERSWFLWFLLLIPGFWIFSVRLMLDIPATFAILLIIFLLVKKSPSYQVGLAMTLLLITKEYYIFIVSPIVITIYLFDAWHLKNYSKVKKLLFILKNFFYIFFPTSAVIIIFLDFNLMPYPRMLDLNLQSIFGDLYIFFNKTALIIIEKVSGSISNMSTNVTEQNTILRQKISNLSFSGDIPRGAVVAYDSTISANFFQKWWLIYKYNFSEADLNIFILPLSFWGLGLRLQNIYHNFKNNYNHYRSDIIFVLLFLAFLYFNYHEAESIHGFRITIPIIISLLYFSFYAIKDVLGSQNKKRKYFFSTLVIFFIFLYWIDIKDFQYGSLLASSSFLSNLLIYKPYIFIIFDIFILILLFNFAQLKIKNKYYLLAGLIICFFVFKFLPNYFDSRLTMNTYGYDYSLTQVTPYLKNNKSKVSSNLHLYKLQYYAADPYYANDLVYPQVRKFDEIYPLLYDRHLIDDNLIYYLKSNNIKYFLYVKNNADIQEYDKLQSIVNDKKNKESFHLIKKQYYANNLVWVLYVFKP